MTRLARVELRRLLRRRLTLFVVLGILLAVGLQVFQTGLQARPMSDSERDPGHRRLRAARNRTSRRTASSSARTACRRRPSARTGDPTADFGCDMHAPALKDFLKPS